MPTADDVLWLKTQFGAKLEVAVSATPLTVDFMVALACQENRRGMRGELFHWQMAYVNQS